MTVLDELREKGLSYLSPLTPMEVQGINEYLLSKPVFADAHVPQTARNQGRDRVPREAAANSECVCVLNDDVLTAPFLLERALELTDVVAQYLDRSPPVMYSANAFWTRPGHTPLRPDIQEFHCDQDDTRFLALFCFLTDVVHPGDGCQELQGPDGVVRTIYGSAGNLFLADTSRLHRGNKPQYHERGLVWFRWGVSDHPPAGVWDKIQPIPAQLLGDRYPADPYLRESIKLLVEPPK